MEYRIRHINFLPKPPPLSLYVHFPWCEQKCPYCDFNSYGLKQQALPLSWQKRYVNALTIDLEQSLAEVYGREIISVFLGGGTPSLFAPEILEGWLSNCRALLKLSPDCEITLEANPGSSEKRRFLEYKHLGINRLSIGVQSFSNAQLKALGRIHCQTEAMAALDAAANAGFQEVNADLMYGLPEQNDLQAASDLDFLLSFPLTHLSYYQLTIEPNTAFFYQPPRLPDQDWLATWEDTALEKIQTAGFVRYEVSAFAKTPSHQCQHNRNYWEYGDYLGLGAGAHSKLSFTSLGKIVRRQRLRQPAHYQAQLEQGEQAVLEEKTVSREARIFEFMLNALRLKNGIAQSVFYERTGVPWSQAEPLVEKLIAQGLLTCERGQLKTSSLGFRFLNQVISVFLPKTNQT